MPTIQKARDAGLMVIVLDTPLDPIDAADATFATDNRKAGELIGQWAQGTLGDKAKDAKHRLPRPRHQPADRRLSARPGLHGGLRHRREGPATATATRTMRASARTRSAEGDQDKGRTAMENALQKCPDVNVVYTINEPAAAGAWEALKARRQGRRQRADRLDRRRLPGREERRGRRHRRDLAAISAQDGVDGARGDRQSASMPANRPKAWTSSTPARRSSPPSRSTASSRSTSKKA